MKIDITMKPLTAANNKTGGWRTSIPQVDLTKCIGCGQCAKVCPEKTIEIVETNGKKKAKTNLEYCKGCGLCATNCPVKAIIMEIEKK